MASLNKVFLIGNLTRDPELRYTPSGAAVASFGLAVNRKYRQGDDLKEDVCFVDITVWNKQAETCTEYLSKGSPILVEGRLNYRTWETDEGQKRSKLDVVAMNVQFLPKGGDSGSSGGSYAKKDAQSRDADDVSPEPEDDIPL